MERSTVNFLEIGFWFGSFIILAISLLSNFSVKVPSSLLQFIRYGRLNFTEIKTNSWLTAIEVPKSWFTHFYLFAVISQSILFYAILNTYRLLGGGNRTNDILTFWVTGLVNVLGGNASTPNVDTPTTVLVTFLYFLHLLRRLYESLFVSVYSNTKMNFYVYLMSYGYYFAAILSLVTHSSGLNTILMKDSVVTGRGLTSFQIIGLAIFFYGNIEQNRAHIGFANLRKGKDWKIDSLKHHIPRGGLFELISSPNYWAEILIYIGLAVIFKFQNPTWNAVTVWVITCQVLAGIMNHKWYLANFPEYPQNRRAIVPYLL